MEKPSAVSAFPVENAITAWLLRARNFLSPPPKAGEKKPAAPTPHPRELYVLFFVEMWERFGFYLMLALLTLYLTAHYKMTEAEASSIYGAYMFSVYLTPLFGGILADRIIGYSRAILIGVVFLAGGYFYFAFQTTQQHIVYAIGVLSVGNGLFKPNISTLVGNLYPQGDPRRDSAFNIFYMGINLGALFSGPVGEFMRGKFGWAIAFATAGVGMMVSFITMAAFKKDLAVADKGGKSSVAQVLKVALPPEYDDKPEDKATERLRIIALTVMCLIVMFFWMAFHQNGTSLTFWARDNTNRVLQIGSWTWEVPVGWFQSVNSVFVITLTPVLVWVMSKLRARGLEPNTPTKIGIGMALAAVSFGIMVIASWLGGDHGKVSMGWLIGCYFVITIAELFLSPMGLSMVTRLAPRRMTSMMMGVWFIATAIGNYLSGFIGRFWKPWKHSEFFMLLVGASLLAVGLLVWQYKRLLAAMPTTDPNQKKNTVNGPPENPGEKSGEQVVPVAGAKKPALEWN